MKLIKICSMASVKNFFSINCLLFLMILLVSCNTQKKDEQLIIVNDQSYFSSVGNHRLQAKILFAGEQSPLPDSLKADFNGPAYYPVDTNFRVAARYEKVVNGEIFKMAASGSVADMYQTVGRLHFNVSGKSLSLEVYENQDLKAQGIEYLFIPFSDLTNGKATYGGGRYIDFTKPESGDRIILDFNYCYQPYCAYNHDYSCPIPPQANKLDVEIMAGEKAL